MGTFAVGLLWDAYFLVPLTSWTKSFFFPWSSIPTSGWNSDFQEEHLKIHDGLCERPKGEGSAQLCAGVSRSQWGYTDPSTNQGINRLWILHRYTVENLFSARARIDTACRRRLTPYKEVVLTLLHFERDLTNSISFEDFLVVWKKSNRCLKVYILRIFGVLFIIMECVVFLI